MLLLPNVKRNQLVLASDASWLPPSEGALELFTWMKMGHAQNILEGIYSSTPQDHPGRGVK